MEKLSLGLIELLNEVSKIDVANQIRPRITFSLREKKTFLISLVKNLNLEFFIWVAGLIILASLNPDGQTHYTICPLKILGFKYCPGCGLGHSISYLFHGDIRQSFDTHILGIPAVIIISHRIFSLLKESLKKI